MHELWRQGKALLQEFQRLQAVNEPTKASFRKLVQKFLEASTAFLSSADEFPDEDIIAEIAHKINEGATTLTADIAKAEEDSPSRASSLVSMPAHSTVRAAPITVALPKFDGNPINWRHFETLFSTAIKTRASGFSNLDQRSLLMEALTTQEAKAIVRSFPIDDAPVEKILDKLRLRFGRPQVVIPLLIKKVTAPNKFTRTYEGLSLLREQYVLGLDSLKPYVGNSLSAFLVYLAKASFGDDLKDDWDKYAGEKLASPDMDDLSVFIEKRCLHMSPSIKPSTATATTQPYPTPSSQPKKPSPKSCVACNESHALIRCRSFAAMDVDRRNKLVREKRLCVNCFSDQHGCKFCPSKFNCRTCNGRHHSLLHKEREQLNPPPTPTTDTAGNYHVASPDDQPPSSVPQAMPSFPNTVTVSLENGTRCIRARAMLDSGAAVSLMTEKLASSLGLCRYPQRMSLMGSFGCEYSKHCVVTSLLSHCRSFISQPITFTVVPKLRPAPVPKNRETILKKPFLKDLSLADPELGGEVDIFIGNMDLDCCVDEGSMKIDGLKVLHTHFGWSIAGPLHGDTTTSTLLTSAVPGNLQDNLQRLWELDQVPEASPHSAEDHEVLQNFNRTFSRVEGRFVVTLPRKKQPPELGNSRRQAIKRLLSNERSLRAKDKLEVFNDVVREYLQLNHAEIIPKDQLNLSPNFYLPVHGVFKDSSTTTKVRAVFDASARTSTGSSLNDTLLPGPNLYPLLPDVLLKFRCHPVGMSADISKMFREILLHPSERDFHRFLMRDDDNAIVECRMLRLTFGVNCSPFLATQVLHKLADIYSVSHPIAAKAILSAFYVDDFLSGASSVEEADKLRVELCDLLSKAGMTLRKWRTNSSELKSRIPPELLETCPLTLPTPRQAPKALGIHWDVERDVLHVSTPTIPQSSTPITKRIIASGTAGVFDILGLFAPAIIPARILLQETWKLSLAWDKPVPEDIAARWSQWIIDLPKITNYSIPRRLCPSSEPVVFRALHGFCDASQVAYGAAIYVRDVTQSGETTVTLVTAKARVLPVKPTTIPKAELLGAHLLAKLIQKTRASLDIDIHNVFAWTDSAIVLHWLPKQPANLERFVANRVQSIQDLLPPSHWRHVRSKDNPADLASRGVPASELIESTLWWTGPSWLPFPPDQWPTPSVSLPVSSTQCHLVQVYTPTVYQPSSLLNSLLSRFSNFNVLNRVFAWICRYIRNSDPDLKDKFRPQLLTTQEVKDAKETLFRMSQEEFFADVFETIKKKTNLPKGHQLARANLCMSKNGHILINSRVRNPTSPKEPKQLVLLSAKSELTRLLIRSLHTTYSHAGISAMTSILGETYYIPNLRNLLKIISKSCPSCQRAYAKPLCMKMGMLPSTRTTPAPPFDNTGVDFAGPFLLRQGYTRKPVYIKTYAVVFVCLCTKAIHLDICSSLSTIDFLACLRRFVARRGCPSHIFSDNGTNFIGAREEIRELQSLTESGETKKAVIKFASEQSIQWHHIPPRAPHFGGLWEAGVKAMKLLLRKNLKPHALRIDEMYTLLTEIEAILNSRPLAPLQVDDIKEGSYLTAGHFLIGRPLKAAPTPSPTKENLSSLKRWNLVKRLTADLWQQWIGTYLASCAQRAKWHRPGFKLRPGHLVFVKDETLRVREWPIAIVTEVHPGDDGEVRAVHIKCRGQTYLRPAHLLIPFLTDDNQEQDPPPSPPGRMSGTSPKQ